MKNKKTAIMVKKITRPKTTRRTCLLAGFIFAISSNSLMGLNPLSSNAPLGFEGRRDYFSVNPTYRMGEELS
jgi:hypothetical protein